MSGALSSLQIEPTRRSGQEALYACNDLSVTADQLSLQSVLRRGLPPRSGSCWRVANSPRTYGANTGDPAEMATPPSPGAAERIYQRETRDPRTGLQRQSGPFALAADDNCPRGAIRQTLRTRHTLVGLKTTPSHFDPWLIPPWQA